MAQGFSFRATGIETVQSLFNKLPKRMQVELIAEMQVVAGEIRDGAKKDAPTDEAKLKQSITVKQINANEFQVIAQSFYAGYLEFGTKSSAVIPAGLEDVASQLKGPVSGQGNPVDALAAWVKRKQIAGTYSVKTGRRTGSKTTQAKQNRALAFLIWRKIKRFGIKPKPFLFKQMEPAEKKLKARVANVIKQFI